jgi:hypothetical protein
MTLLYFILFSSLEYFSSFVFISIQFRFSIRENILKIILISLLLSFVSYSLINADLRGISPLIQTLIFLIYIYLLMKVSIINSIIMVLTGYIVLGLVQTCIVAVLSHLGIVAGELEVGAAITYKVQVASSVFMLILSFLTYYFKGGFSFIEAHGRFTKKSFVGKNKWFIVGIFVVFIITTCLNIFMLESKNPQYLAVASVLLVALIFLSYITFKRDEIID